MPKTFLCKNFIVIIVLLVELGVLATAAAQAPPTAKPAPQATNTGKILEATEHPGTLMGVQYESWFTPHNLGSYEHAEAIPILGKYSSYDVKVIRKHEEWFEDLGVDWLLLDWSNMLWSKPAWEEHRDSTRELEETAALLFQTYHQMDQEGRHPPKLVIMVGLENGAPVPHAVERLNGIIAWTTKNFLANPAYKNQWLYYHGKPLLVILNNVGLSCEAAATQTAGLEAPGWTVRFMGSQLQDTHMEKCGYWSWIDSPIQQILTRRDGVPEEVVVTPSSYPIPGSECNVGCNTMLGNHWLDPRAVGRDHGAPYLESWKVAFENRPKFIQIHQWNEYAEQYNLDFSDDLEPTQMDACGERVCGGWGYYFVNLTRALISLYRGQTPDITVLALSGPFQPAAVNAKQLPLTWNVLGKQPDSYTLQLDGRTVAENIHGNQYVLDLSHSRPGRHRVTLVANGAHTYFDLAPEKLTVKSKAPLAVTSTIEFTLEYTYTPGAGGSALN